MHQLEIIHTNTTSGWDLLQWTQNNHLRDWAGFQHVYLPPSPNLPPTPTCVFHALSHQQPTHLFTHAYHSPTLPLPNALKYLTFLILHAPPNPAPLGVIILTQYHPLPPPFQQPPVALSLIEVNHHHRHQHLSKELLHHLCSQAHLHQWALYRTPPLRTTPHKFTQSLTNTLTTARIPWTTHSPWFAAQTPSHP